jgi:hypothetical protein
VGVVVAVVVIAAGLGLFLALGRGGDESSSSPTGGASGQPTRPAAAAKPTNMPLPAAPNVVAGVQVDQPAVDFGKFPTDTPLRQVFTLKNTNAEVVTLGKSKIEVLEGC